MLQKPIVNRARSAIRSYYTVCTLLYTCSSSVKEYKNNPNILQAHSTNGHSVFEASMSNNTTTIVINSYMLHNGKGRVTVTVPNSTGDLLRGKVMRQNSSGCVFYVLLSWQESVFSIGAMMPS